MNYSEKLHQSMWLSLLKTSRFRFQFFLTLFFLFLILIIYRAFLDFAEARPGVVLKDPILGLFDPIDLTWLIFALIYLCLAAGILSLLKQPEKLLLAVQAYILIILVRIAAMYFVPFEAPEKLIVLRDPFVEMFGAGNSLTKDLFFSGHTSTLFLLYLAAESKKLKLIFILSAAVVGVSIILQHVHYVVDVFAAPFFTHACFKIVSKLKLFEINL